MRSLASVGLALALSTLTACQPQTISEQKPDVIPAKAEAPGGSGDQNPSDEPIVKPMKPDVYKLYPPIFTAFSLMGNSRYFGYTANAEQPSSTVLAYVVGAFPDFEGLNPAPNFRSQAEVDAFMEEWSQAFAKNPDNIKQLDDLVASLRWVADPALIRNENQEIPAFLLEGPEYVRITQRTLARRITFLGAGKTEMTMVLPEKQGTLTVPFEIEAYTPESLALGKSMYEDPANGCAGCHGENTSIRSAYLKHSSDYLGLFTVAQILGIARDSVYPSGEELFEGQHKFLIETPEKERGIIAYLRNSRPYLDKISKLRAAQGAAMLVPRGQALRPWTR